jgi:hypothetical protein
MRIYIPATLPRLREIVEAGGLPPGFLAYAVTPALREWYTDGDAEELEYVAMTDAARDSLRQLAVGTGAPARRVVIAADVPDTALVALSSPIDEGSRAVVRVSGATPMHRFASVHVDGDDAVDDVRAALGAVPDADAGDEDAQFLLDSVEDHELLWYAAQEIPDLVSRA